MRLQSATIRNYRVHRELSVDFDPHRTLVGGPNETGKSTLIEAIHNALFLKAKVTGKARNAMLSLVTGGVPEVELVFEHDGATYTIFKKFGGGSGSVRLQRHGGTGWHGEEAEGMLAALLGVAEVSAGGNIASRVREQWSHLWVWQGTSGDDPIANTHEHNHALLQRLQETGGAVVRQSPLDQRLADQLLRQVDEIYTNTGKPRQHSDLERATTAALEAERRMSERNQQLDVLQQAVAEVEQAHGKLKDVADRLARLTPELAEVEARVVRAEALQRQEQAQVTLGESRQAMLATLQKAEDELAGFRREVAALATHLAPKEAELAGAQAALGGLRGACDALALEVQEAAARERAARRRKDLAEAARLGLERRHQLTELSRQAEDVARLQRERETLNETLQRLPKITQKDVDALTALAHRHQQAEVALQAMAAGIEVVSTDHQVLVDGTALAEGETRIVTAAAEIAVGSGLRLRVRPGGGNALEDAREGVSQAAAAMVDALVALQVRSREEAGTILAERRTYEARVAESDALLRGMQAEQLPTLLEQARAAANEADGELQRLSDALQVGEALPVNIDDAGSWARTLAAKLADAEQAQSLQAELQRQKVAERDELAARAEGLRLDLLKEKDRHDQLVTLIGDRLRALGEDAARQEALGKAQADHDEATGRLAALRAVLAELQPELLADDRERLLRALRIANDEGRDAEVRKAVTEAQLRSDGSRDPAAEAAEALAEAERAQAHLDATRQRAEAVRWLAELFSEEQRSLVNQYTQPLAEKISEYLRCLFGPGTRAEVTWDAEENRLDGIRLVRGTAGAALDFDVLSGGTREQLAAAVRLAVAEVLAEDYDGTLPVVLDDAFAYADPMRVDRLQRMLDRAASKGLQVIVLSCTPSDYAALGARTIELGVPVAAPSGLATVGPRDGPVADEPLEQTVSVAAASASEGDPETFLETLRAMGGRSGNQSLVARLGWDEARYLRVKEGLLADRRVLPGRGRGGSVSLPGSGGSDD